MVGLLLGNIFYFLFGFIFFINFFFEFRIFWIVGLVEVVIRAFVGSLIFIVFVFLLVFLDFVIFRGVDKFQLEFGGVKSLAD